MCRTDEETKHKTKRGLRQLLRERAAWDAMFAQWKEDVKQWPSERGGWSNTIRNL